MMIRLICVITLTVTSAQDLYPVAFTVGHDRHFEIGSTPNRLDVPYALTLSNRLANLNHGVFTCHEHGLYKFQAYALTKTNAKLFLEILHNDYVVASLWGHTPGDYASAGNAVVLHLSSGDVVKVVTRASHEMALYGQQGQIYTTFTGVQLDMTYSYLRVGFSAYLDHSMIAAHGTTLVLTPTHTNVNHVYDGNGKSNFNAPDDGLYIFHLFGLAEKNGELWLEIHHNHGYAVSIYGKTDQDWANAGNTVILHLAHGDFVYIRTRGNRDSNLYGRPDQKYTTWSGAQLTDGTHAFSAGLTHNQNFAAGSTVVFDRVFVNTDGIYNAGNGIMTVQRPGLYEFNVHALGQKNEKIWLDLYRNGGYEVSLYGHNPNHYGAASNSAVLTLEAGDHVFVKAHNEAHLYGASDQIYCTFSGHLMQMHHDNGGH